MLPFRRDGSLVIRSSRLLVGATRGSQALRFGGAWGSAAGLETGGPSELIHACAAPTLDRGRRACMTIEYA